jgi:hypothetical protein
MKTAKTNLGEIGRVSQSSLLVFSRINVLALGAVADLGAKNCQYTTKFDAS